jgi:FtsP/CotA-like multicopper oxidase with cupredoxin domain
MAARIPLLHRRDLLTGLGATALVPALPAIAAGQSRPALALQAKESVIAWGAGKPDTPIWTLEGPGPAIRVKRGDIVDMVLGNSLPVPMATSWRGIDGVPAAAPLTARAPLAAGANETVVIPLRHAGTFLCDVSLLGDGQARASRALPLIVGETDPVAVDRDEVLLIEEWRLRSDSTAVAPGVDPNDTVPLYTLNGRTSFELSAFGNQRLRLRFINGSQRTVLAVKLENHDVRVMAIDGQPSEPFSARNGVLVLAPGARADAFVDTRTTSPIVLHDGKQAHQIGTLAIFGYTDRRAPLLPAPPLPSNGLPAQLDLKSALRIDLALGGADWVAPATFAATAAPAFRAKAGRIVVLALTNRAAMPTVFHLHGHHFRWLDRLDDGWKPFWLDTLAIEPGQTQRIAFLAEHAGRWLLESVATDWAAPRFVRWYSVE